MNRLRSLSKSPKLPRFTYIYNIEYHFTEVNGSSTKDEAKEPLDLQQLCSVFDECYPSSLLCVLLMKKSFSEETVGGQFLVHLNTKQLIVFCILKTVLFKNRGYSQFQAVDLRGPSPLIS